MKASKVNACIIYMAAMACGDTGGMGMKEMAEMLGVGLSTMKKHEKMLRDALV